MSIEGKTTYSIGYCRGDKEYFRIKTVMGVFKKGLRHSQIQTWRKTESYTVRGNLKVLEDTLNEDRKTLKDEFTMFSFWNCKLGF